VGLLVFQRENSPAMGLFAVPDTDGDFGIPIVTVTAKLT
jgi:hypothetical protein